VPLRISDEAFKRIADVLIDEAERLASQQRTCGYCGKPIPLSRTTRSGRPAAYCDRKCRQNAFNARQKAASA
jgi:hypothetical protein